MGDKKAASKWGLASVGAVVVAILLWVTPAGQRNAFSVNFTSAALVVFAFFAVTQAFDRYYGD